MLSNKSLRIAGAAMLGTVAFLGTNAANAIIDLDSTSKSDAAVTYAKETLTTAVTGKDGSTYYEVNGGGVQNLLHVSGKVGVGGTTDSVLIIQYMFDGMVLTGGSKPKLRVGKVDATKRGGGGEGDNNVSFILTRDVTKDSEVVNPDVTAVLDLEEIAVSADVSGTVTMNVSDNLPLPAVYNESYQGAVRVASAIKPVATPATPVATVVSKFFSFEVDTVAGQSKQIATVGTFKVEEVIDPKLRTATKGVEIKAGDLGTVVNLGVVTPNPKTIEATTSSVTISGDFSFASSVTLTDKVCALGGMDLRMDVDTTTKVRDTTQLQPQTLAYVNTNNRLCIHVLAAGDKDAVAISETAPYVVTTKYALHTDFKDSKFSPPSGIHKLGSIDRDGTTVRLPYLTTNDRFNQRIYIVNRGSDTTYVLTFNGEGDEKGMDAEGSLPGGGTRTILSLRDDDVVTISGRSSTSGTLIVEAEPKMIDVATNQINRELGTSDTVVYSTSTNE